MEYKPSQQMAESAAAAVPLSDEEVSAMLKANGVEPTEVVTSSAPDVEACYIKSDPPGDEYCPADNLLANVAFDLAHVAYSSLVNTPQGLPGNGFYLWDRNSLIDGCCDALSVSLADYRPYNYMEHRFGEVFSNYIASGLCDELNYVAAFDITLLRSCRPIFSTDGRDQASSGKRNAHGYNLMVDARTMVCCMVDCLSKENIGGIDFDKNFYVGRTRISGQSHCSSVTFEVGLNLPACCPDGDYKGLLQKFAKE